VFLLFQETKVIFQNKSYTKTSLCLKIPIFVKGKIKTIKSGLMNGITDVRITKSLFVEIIEDMRVQHYYDKSYSQSVSELFGMEASVLYDNSKYLSSLMKLLRLHFPIDGDGFCDIEHYCFFLDFGKCGDDYESPEELYDRLVNG
jgi:hypothetical protein